MRENAGGMRYSGRLFWAACTLIYLVYRLFKYIFSPISDRYYTTYDRNTL